MRSPLWIATAGLIAATLPAPVGAQQPSVPTVSAPKDSRTTVYQAAFFAQYRPAHRVRHRPARARIHARPRQHAKRERQVDVRGFAGTAGNVVINGARPSTKAETLDVTLSRIPAQRVVRVEVGPGDLYGSDYAGKSQVLNVILSQAAGFDANVTASAKRWSTGYVNTDISGSALIRRGPSTINLSAGTGRNRQLEEGTDILDRCRRPASSSSIAASTTAISTRTRSVAASWALERGSDNAIRINARWQPSTFDLFQSNRVTPTGGAAARRQSRSRTIATR